MIDYRDLCFDRSAVEGITVALDRHLGPCIAGKTEGGIVLARLLPVPWFHSGRFCLGPSS